MRVESLPIALAELDDVARGTRAPGGPALDPADIVPLDCPCCNQKIAVPTVDHVIDHYRVAPMEAAILRAVWKGKGRPVQAQVIFNSMYADDPDGGPGEAKMYNAFKVALHFLRHRLSGSGVSVENVGYRLGYKLVLGIESSIARDDHTPEHPLGLTASGRSRKASRYPSRRRLAAPPG